MFKNCVQVKLAEWCRWVGRLSGLVSSGFGAQLTI